MGPDPAAAMQHDDQRPAAQFQPVAQHHHGGARNPAGFDGEPRRRLEAGDERKGERQRGSAASGNGPSPANEPFDIEDENFKRAYSNRREFRLFALRKQDGKAKVKPISTPATPDFAPLKPGLQAKPQQGRIPLKPASADARRIIARAAADSPKG